MDIKNIYERVEERDDAQEIELVSKKHEYKDVYSFRFKANRGYEFTPGQFGHFLLHDFNLNRGKPVRDFSLANTKDEDVLISMHVRSGSEYKKKIDELEEGDKMTMFKIRGGFTLEENLDKEIVFLAGGIGITPIRSMLLSYRDANTTLLHVSDRDYLYEDELKTHSFPQIRVASYEAEKAVRDIYKEKKDAIYYVSGPPRFVRFMRKELVTLGLPLENIKQDSFDGYEDL
jgi:ferredoxin-NADP reductase